MARHWFKIVFLLLLVAAFFLAKHYLGDYLTVESVKQHKTQLLSYIDNHYFKAALCLILLFFTSGLFLPGALALTIAGGMMFGTLPTVLYANVGATAGAIVAFIAARHLMGKWFQERFKRPLARFNDEMSRHGKNYLLILRMVPIAPFFVINYCAGVTKIPWTTFLWTTSLGLIPGSFIHAFVGTQLRHLNTASDLLSWKLIAALLLLPLSALAPVVIHHWQARKK